MDAGEGEFLKRGRRAGSLNSSFSYQPSAAEYLVLVEEEIP